MSVFVVCPSVPDPSKKLRIRLNPTFQYCKKVADPPESSSIKMQKVADPPESSSATLQKVADPPESSSVTLQKVAYPPESSSETL